MPSAITYIQISLLNDEIKTPKTNFFSFVYILRLPITLTKGTSLWYHDYCYLVKHRGAGHYIECFVKILSKDNKNRNAIFREGGVDNFSHEIITSYRRKLVEL